MVASDVPATLKECEGLTIQIRIGNEFGLWRGADWEKAVGDIEIVRLTVTSSDAAVEVLTPSPVIGADGCASILVFGGGKGAATVRIATEKTWARPALAVLTLPIAVGMESDFKTLVETCGATSSRELAFGALKVVVAEAPGSLGIAGKLWDAAFSLVDHVATHHLDDLNDSNAQ